MRYRYALVMLVACLMAVAGCGLLQDEQAPTAPTPVVEQPAPAPPVVVEAPKAPEPFCPFRVFDNLDATQAGTKLIVTWNPTFGPEGKGQYLRRYQIEVKGSEPTVILEAEIRSLTGADKVEYERTIVGRASQVRVRAWYPNECHGDPAGPRLNTEWAGPVAVYIRN